MAACPRATSGARRQCTRRTAWRRSLASVRARRPRPCSACSSRAQTPLSWSRGTRWRQQSR
eukprot:7148121-Alexandrium_andersonii.AAC.1